MNRSNFFIAIGPPKTGTSWLYSNLQKHPKISLPKVKEIRYFWAKEFLNDTIKNRLLNNHWYYRGKREVLLSFLKEHLDNYRNRKSINWSELNWDLRFFFYKHNENWYKSLFDKNLMSGDITPKYCELSENSIEEIKKMVPDCKIIISLRDPVERQWSRAKMNLLKSRGKKSMAEVSENRVLAQFSDELQHQSNNYVELIHRWKKYFPEENILVYHFGELKEDPEKLFNKVCDFLNIRRVAIPGISVKRNKGLQHTIPKKYLDKLVNLNIDFIREYAKIEDRYSKLWLAKYT